MFQSIMIVDDSKVSRMMIKRIISEIAPAANLIEAANGDEALALLGENDVDAAVVDFHMPGIDGLQLVEQMKATQPDLPITLMTANIQNEIKNRAEELGVGYLTKPAKKEDLASFLGG